jgi:hypothetical protein
MSEQAETVATVCGKPRRYFPQQTCYLSRGHGGDHEDDTHMWENAANPAPEVTR